MIEEEMKRLIVTKGLIAPRFFPFPFFCKPFNCGANII